MLIVVNTCFAEPLQNTGNYYRQLLTKLLALCPQHHFLFLSYESITDGLPDHPNAAEIITRRRSGNPILKRRIEQFRLNRLVKKQKPQLILNCQGTISFDEDIPQFLLLDETALYPNRTWKKNLGINLERSAKVLVASNHQKEQLSKKYTLQQDKIEVIGAGPEWPAAVLAWDEKESIKAGFSASKEYFICHNPQHTNNQLVVLLRAFSLFKKRQQSNMQLLLPASLGEKNRDWLAKLDTYKFRSDVHLVQASPTNEMTAVIASAYGIIDLANSSKRPEILQAFGCDTPVIISAEAGAKEWTGQDAALFIDSSSPESIANQMMLLYKDEYLRKRLIEEGRKQLAVHNWDDAAKKLQQALEAAVNNS